ncbi:MAG: glycoside hydrolase family 27 protein [Bacteroidales bacterium]
MVSDTAKFLKFRRSLLKAFLSLFFTGVIFWTSAQPVLSSWDSLALTPPMGWNSWNSFEYQVSETIIMEIADAMVANGMRDAGYEYIIIDDFWVGGRDRRNVLFPDPERFPSGIKKLSDYVHSKGLKLGIYSDAAEYTCGGVTGSLGFEELDAKTFADWGIDYLKYDYCNAPKDITTAFTRYKKMGDALKNCGRPIVYAICEWGQRKPWLWAKAAGGHLWRTTWDSRDAWQSNDNDLTGIMEIYVQQKGLEKYAGPGGWNDPDMLMTGLYGKGKSSSFDHRFTGCTFTEYRTHFALWCMLASPLILNADLRNLDEETLQLITNPYLISINQDELGKQARIISETDGIEVSVKPLSNKRWAVCVFNKNGYEKDFSLDIKQHLQRWEPLEVFDVWQEKTLKNTKQLKGKLQAHDCKIFILNQVKDR